MAKKTSSTDDEGEIDAETGKPVLTNIKARSICIQDGFKKLYELRRQKESLEVEHLNDVKDEIKTLKRTLKADTDIDSKDLDLAFKVYERERLAREMEDDDTDRIQDNLLEVFRALKGGEMVNFLDILEAA